MAAAPASIADQVRAQLLGDYPPSALKWVDGLSWRGPVQVPLTQIDFSDSDPDWKPARANRAKIASFAAKIRQGFRKPVTLIQAPGSQKMRCVDGHNRCLAYLSLAAPVTAWVGTAKSGHGPWDLLHSQQIDMANAPGLTSREGMISLDLPGGTIRPVPGGLGDHHVTVVYLGPDLDDAAFARACSRAASAAASVPGPITGTVSGVSSFRPSAGSEGKVPAFAPVTIPSWQALRSELEDLSASEHKDWVPHVTLAYVGKGDPLPDPVPRTSVKFTHLSVHRGSEVKRFPLGGSDHAGDSPALDLSAQTPIVSTVHHPFGSPSGPGLWRMKGVQLPAYIQNVAHALLRTGRAKDESSAIQLAAGAIQRWASGGGKVTPEVRAAAAKALAEWEALRAAAHAHANDSAAIDLAGMFTESLHPRVGGKFASKGGQPVAAARARNAPKTPAVQAPAGLAGPMTRAQQLHYQAAQDRHLAQQIMAKVAALVRARDAAIAGLSPGKVTAPVNAAKSAAAKKAALSRKAGTAKAKAKTSARKAGPKRTRVQRLNGQIKLLRNDARLLLKAADHLDAEAAKS